MNVYHRISLNAQNARVRHWLKAPHDPELLALIQADYAKFRAFPLDEVLGFGPCDIEYLDDEALTFVYSNFRIDIMAHWEHNPPSGSSVQPEPYSG